MENRIYNDIESLRRVRTVGNNVAPGTALLDAGKPAVTLTGSGDYVNTASIDFGNGDTIAFTRKGGGIGLKDNQATLTYTGTYAWDVEGASATAAYDEDGNGKIVYITDDGDLTLEEGGTEFGVVDFFRGELSPTDTAVKIGVTL